ILGREPGPAPVPAAPATSVRGPARFESNYDLLITMLSVTGILFVVGGVALLLSGQGVELGLIDLRPATAGVIVSLYGFFLTIAADRARNYRRLPRLLLLALSGLLLATGVGAPIALLVWWQLQRHDMRVYLNARAGGMSSARAAAVAQNLPPPLDTDTDLLDAQRQPSRAFGVMRALMWTAALAALGSLLILMFG
ncbi:MAG: hypothetical protein ACE10D_06115, partial [Planctomycetota bacterium]